MGLGIGQKTSRSAFVDGKFHIWARTGQKNAVPSDSATLPP
jgi:hypothetical protein